MRDGVQASVCFLQEERGQVSLRVPVSIPCPDTLHVHTHVCMHVCARAHVCVCGTVPVLDEASLGEGLWFWGLQSQQAG